MILQTGDADDAYDAEEIRAEVEEKEVIIKAFRKGVLEETRRELREQRREAAALAAGGPRVAAGEEEGAAKAKRKAAKRKQQTRKAQQQKKAPRWQNHSSYCDGGRRSGDRKSRPAWAAGGTEGTAGAGGQGEEEAEEEDGNDHEEKGKDGEQAVTAAAAAFAAMAISGIKGQEEEEEEEEGEECSVCLNAIQRDDAANPAGPPLMCGHRYHLSAFLGGEMYEQVHRADLPLLPVVFARSGKDLRDGLVIVHIEKRLVNT
jgi:hypothetical protein